MRLPGLCIDSAIRGVSDGVLPLMFADTRWSGEIDVTLREALERERRRVQDGGR